MRLRWNYGDSNARATDGCNEHCCPHKGCARKGFAWTKTSVRTGELLWGLLIAFVSLPPLGPSSSAAEGLASKKVLPRIEAGTWVEPTESGRWNRVVLLARPRISSGDVHALPAMIRDNVSTFVLTIMASVEQTTDPQTGELKYRLADLGVGYSTDVDGRLRIVTVDDAARIGVSLGFFSRMMLAENEKQLLTARIIARTSTLMIVDTPAFLLRDGKHKEYVMRHFIWIDPRTGRNAALVWLINLDAQNGYVVEADEPMRWAPAGLEEDRAIHVDGKQFSMLGIPNEKAFAIENLPPGKPVPWTDAARSLAALQTFDTDSLRDLSRALNVALQSMAASP